MANLKKNKGNTTGSNLSSDMIKNIDNYGNEIIHIEGTVNQIRTRPGMYIGPLGAAGLLNMFREIFQNSIDQLLYEYSPCNFISVTYDERDYKVIVSDNGMGIPFDKMVQIYTEGHTGKNLGVKKKGDYSAGTNGIGAKATNALSEYFDVKSYMYYGECKHVRFKKGVLVKEEILKNPQKIQGTVVEFEPDHVNAIDTDENILGKFEFNNVYFSYVPEKPLIQNFNLKVNAGDTVAIVGPTGAGKTTLVNLIMRFYEINEGTIKLDGVDTKDYKRNILRGSIGMVLQDTWLFRGTIRENLLYGDENATFEDIKAACKQAHIDHFIETLPGKYDFVLNEDGTNISQGQRQLLTIARAIISKPKIMILDEATSSVDTRTEQQIQDALDNIMQNKTSFIIAHRLSTIKNAKLIIVMKKGNIVETGNHKELLARNGFYAELYNSQFIGNNLTENNSEVEES